MSKVMELIAQVEEEKRRHEDHRQACRQNYIDMCLDMLRSAVNSVKDGLWEELVPYFDVKEISEGNFGNKSFRQPVNAHALGIAPFAFVVESEAGSSRPWLIKWPMGMTLTDYVSIAEIGRFLYERAEEYRSSEVVLKAMRVREIMGWLYEGKIETTYNLDQIEKELEILAPDQSNDWRPLVEATRKDLDARKYETV